MGSKDNREKARNGMDARLALSEVLRDLMERGAIVSHNANPTYGYEGYDNAQFKADDEIVLANGSRCVLYSTSSIRSDRVKGQQWDAFNIKQIEPGIHYAFIVVPDESAVAGSFSFRERIRSGDLFSAIDDILSIEDFHDLGMEKAFSGPGATTREVASEDPLRLFCSIVCEESNLDRYNGTSLYVGFHYTLFRQCMVLLGIQPEHASILQAAPSPTKTLARSVLAKSVIVRALRDSVPYASYRVSVFEALSASQIMCESSAHTIVNALDPENYELLDLLVQLQDRGTSSLSPEQQERLSEHLVPLRRRLYSWVFRGCPLAGGGEEGCLAVWDRFSGAFHMHELSEYCRTWEGRMIGSGDFGTAFRWRSIEDAEGKLIRLKSRLIC